MIENLRAALHRRFVVDPHHKAFQGRRVVERGPEGEEGEGISVLLLYCKLKDIWAK